MSGKKTATKKQGKGRESRDPEVVDQPESAVDGATGEPTPVEAEVEQPEVVVEFPAAPAAAEAGSELEVMKDRLARLQADFENYRKRVLREKDETYRRANEDIMEELLPVLDHLGLAFSTARDEDLKHPVVAGVKLVAEQLRGALAKFGLEAIDAEGQVFDPNLHEAISHLPSPDVPENGVMAQVRCGYRLGSYLLRPAQVVVSSGAPAEAAAPADPESSESADA